MAKMKWQSEKVVEVNGIKRRCYARATRSEIIVRVENDGDTTKYSEWGMPKFLGLNGAMDQAAAQTRPKDIRE